MRSALRIWAGTTVIATAVALSVTSERAEVAELPAQATIEAPAEGPWEGPEPLEREWTEGEYWYSVSVTPNGGSGGTVPANGSGSSNFTVEFNTDDPMAFSELFDLSCGGTNGMGCSVQSWINLTPGVAENVSVDWTTGSSTGTGTVTLSANGRYVSAWNSGYRVYTIVALVEVTEQSIPDSVAQ